MASVLKLLVASCLLHYAVATTCLEQADDTVSLVQIRTALNSSNNDNSQKPYFHLRKGKAPPVIHGSVQCPECPFHDGALKDWTTVTMNHPITSGNRGVLYHLEEVPNFLLKVSRSDKFEKDLTYEKRMGDGLSIFPKSCTCSVKFSSIPGKEMDDHEKGELPALLQEELQGVNLGDVIQTIAQDKHCALNDRYDYEAKQIVEKFLKLDAGDYLQQLKVWADRVHKAAACAFYQIASAEQGKTVSTLPPFPPGRSPPPQVVEQMEKRFWPAFHDLHGGNFMWAKKKSEADTAPTLWLVDAELDRESTLQKAWQSTRGKLGAWPTFSEGNLAEWEVCKGGEWTPVVLPEQIEEALSTLGKSCPAEASSSS